MPVCNMHPNFGLPCHIPDNPLKYTIMINMKLCCYFQLFQVLEFLFCLDLFSGSQARSSSSSSVHPPKRPGFGTVGRPIDLRANFFRLSFSPKLTCLYHYDVEITPNKCPKAVKRDVVNAIVRNNRDTFRGHEPGFDGEKNLISFIQLPSPVSFK